MKGFTIAVFACALLLAYCVANENPGIVAGLKMPIINKLKAQIVPMIMEEFEQLDVDDVKKGDVSITGITVKVDLKSHENIQLSLNQEKNALGTVVSDTHINVHLNWRYKKSILKFTGTGDIKGTINHVGMNIGFETQEKEGQLVPKINIQDFDLSFDKKSFHFHFNCKACPSKVTDLILNAFKGPLLDTIKKQARKEVDKKVVNKINKQLLEKYPLSVELNDELSISTASTGPVSVQEAYINAPIDGTVFLTNEGHNRPFEAPEIPVEDPSHPGEILLFISKYVYRTVENSVNKVPLTFDTSLLGMNVHVDVDGTKTPLEIDTRDGELHMLGGATISINALRTVIELGASADIDIFFKPGNSKNMMFIDPDIDRESIKFTSLKVSVFGVQVNLGWVAGIINFLITFAIDWIVFPQIAIPKAEILPIQATAAQIDFFEKFTEAGIAFNFGID